MRCCSNAALFGDYTPIIVGLLETMAEEDLAHFRPGVLWAIGRLGGLAEGHVEHVMPEIEAALAHDDPQVRGMAVWCLGRLGHAARLTEHAALTSDEGPVEVFADGEVVHTSVRELTAQALAPDS